MRYVVTTNGCTQLLLALSFWWWWLGDQQTVIQTTLSKAQRNNSLLIMAFVINPLLLPGSSRQNRSHPRIQRHQKQQRLYVSYRHRCRSDSTLPRRLLTEMNGRLDNEMDDFLGRFDDKDEDDDDEETFTFGNTWVRPSKTRLDDDDDDNVDDDDDDDDTNVVGFFFDNDETAKTSSGSSNTAENRRPNEIFFDVGIDGRMMETGPLSLKMYTAIVQSRNNNKKNSNSLLADSDTNPTLRRTIYEIVVTSTAKEAVKVTLEQSGLQLLLADNNNNNNDAYDSMDWGTIESIRIDQNDDTDDDTILRSDGTSTTYNSWDHLLEQSSNDIGWKPGTSFSFVVRNVPTARTAVSMDELLSSLDPDGTLRNQALDAGIINTIPDDDDDDETNDSSDEEDEDDHFPLTTLKELFEDNYRRVEQSPRTVDNVDAAYTGTNKGGYRIVHANGLLHMVNEINSRLDNNEKITAGFMKQFKNTTMHVMDALVSHGCLIVEVTGGNISTNQTSRANILYQMWQTTESLYQNVIDNDANQTVLPSWETIYDTGSVHAKVGYKAKPGSIDDKMSILETRQRFEDGQILPIETTALYGPEGYNSMLEAYRMITELCQATIQIAVGASTQETGLVDTTTAMIGARRLVNELVDNGQPLQSKVPNRANDDSSVSNSPHRLLRYGETDDDDDSLVGDDLDAEIFGAHTDTTFITAVPVASIPGLEVYDDDAQLWYRPELAVQRQHHDRPNDINNSKNNNNNDDNIPWYARYIVLMPGELLQISTCNEVPAAVHRVVDGRYSQSRSGSNNSTSSLSIRYSAPVLLRGRSGLRFDCERYFGVSSTSSSNNNRLSSSKEQQQDEEELLQTKSSSTTVDSDSSNSSAMWPIWIECHQRTMDEIDSALQGRPDKK